jgi:quercetin 2,3-dioxygenase
VNFTATPGIDVRRASERFATNIGWLNSNHSFSFGRHYDPKNTGHGLLLVNNDDIVRGGSGFDTHPHRDMEIVTWVLSGELEHRDSEKNRGVLYPGLAQRMSAGRGIWHSEMNNSGTDDVHFVQMCLVPIASGKGHDAAISIRQAGAVLYGGRLQPGETVTVPDDRHVHVFVPRGAASLTDPDVALTTGDAVRLTEAGDLRLTAGDDGAEVLIWATA